MDDLLQRYLRGEVSDEERRRFMQWLEEDPSHQAEFRTRRKLYDILLWQSPEKETSVRRLRLPSLRKVAWELLKVAAVVALVLGGVRYFSRPSVEQPSRMQSVYVPAGQRVELTLADGTSVWLNARSTLRFPERFTGGKRVVELDGEGFFAVEHDATTPFVVETPHYDVQVLGTEFNVKAYGESPLFETALLRGSVEISAPDKGEALRLKPDEMATAAGGALQVHAITDHNYFKWREGLFCFENETVEHLIEKLQLYYDVRIRVENRSLLQYPYSGKFRIKDGVEHVLRVLQLKHKFTYVKNEEKNEIIIQ